MQEREQRWKQYSKTTRNILRKATPRLNFKVNDCSRDIFFDLYKKTMNKNNADEFYYFNEYYFYF